MKQALIRLAMAAFLAMVHMALFRTPHSKPYGPLYSFGGFIFLWAVWIVPIEGQHLIRNIIYNRKLKP